LSKYTRFFVLKAQHITDILQLYELHFNFIHLLHIFVTLAEKYTKKTKLFRENPISSCPNPTYFDKIWYNKKGTKPAFFISDIDEVSYKLKQVPASVGALQEFSSEILVDFTHVNGGAVNSNPQFLMKHPCTVLQCHTYENRLLRRSGFHSRQKRSGK